jgi:hypothetical protein
MKAKNGNLFDSMAVTRDAARKSKKASGDKGRLKRIKVAKKRSAPVPVPFESTKTLGKKVVAIRAAVASTARTTGAALRATINHKAVPVKVTVKQAVLDVFYADQKKVLSTKDAVAAIQASNPGMNESSIRVWISDFRKDGSIKLVKKDGREAILKAGKLGKFALR